MLVAKALSALHTLLYLKHASNRSRPRARGDVGYGIDAAGVAGARGIHDDVVLAVAAAGRLAVAHIARGHQYNLKGTHRPQCLTQDNKSQNSEAKRIALTHADCNILTRDRTHRQNPGSQLAAQKHG